MLAATEIRRVPMYVIFGDSSLSMELQQLIFVFIVNIDHIFVSLNPRQIPFPATSQKL